MLYSIYSFNPKGNQTGTRVKVTPCPFLQKVVEESQQMNLVLAV